MGTQVKSAEQIRMKFALLLSAFVASTFAAPKATNALTCNICVDIITDIDEFITDDDRGPDRPVLQGDLPHPRLRDGLAHPGGRVQRHVRVQPSPDHWRPRQPES